MIEFSTEPKTWRKSQIMARLYLFAFGYFNIPRMAEIINELKIDN